MFARWCVDFIQLYLSQSERTPIRGAFFDTIVLKLKRDSTVSDSDSQEILNKACIGKGMENVQDL